MPLEHLLENEFEVVHQTKQPFSDVENLPYWKFEKFVEFLNKKNDEQKKEHKKQNEQKQNNVGKYNPNSFMKKFKSPKY
jgi:TPP-dependent 2-oxoacid decarboxylase